MVSKKDLETLGLDLSELPKFAGVSTARCEAEDGYDVCVFVGDAMDCQGYEARISGRAIARAKSTKGAVAQLVKSAVATAAAKAAVDAGFVR